MSNDRFNKKPAETQEEGAPAWMNTYGDMVTLLLTFFVLLFSFSVIDAQKWAEIASAFAGTPVIARQALDGNVGDEISIPGIDNRIQPSETGLGDESGAEEAPDPTITDPDADLEDIPDDFTLLYKEMKSYIELKGLDTVLSIKKDDDVILLRVRDSALFDSGKAIIKDNAIALLDQTAGVFDKYNQAIKMVRIEGHTDNVPMTSPKYEDNWILSTSRATTVLRYFLNCAALKPEQYSAVGYGEFQPISTNETEEGKAANRRVDFVIIGYNMDIK